MSNVDDVKIAFYRNHTRDNDAQFFLARIDRYPWTAQSPVSVKPTLVPGDTMSVRLRAGWRVWGFETEAERNTFIAQFGGRMFP